jgi:hypothetical protein
MAGQTLRIKHEYGMSCISSPHCADCRCMISAFPSVCLPAGQDSHARIAHHYGIPVASIRDALYDVMFDDQLLLAAVGMTRRQLLSASVVHPSTAGHILYSQIIA